MGDRLNLSGSQAKSSEKLDSLSFFFNSVIYKNKKKYYPVHLLYFIFCGVSTPVEDGKRAMVHRGGFPPIYCKPPIPNSNRFLRANLL